MNPQKKTLTARQKALFQGNTMRPKKKILGGSGTTLNVSASSTTATAPQTVHQMIQGNSALVQDCINVIIQCDPDQECTKEELISRIEYQKNILLKKHQGVRDKKIIAMEKILGDLRNEQIREGMASMEITRDAQNKIVLANQMEENVYKQKIDLTLPDSKRKLGDDPNCVLLKNSKQWWNLESKKKYKAPPNEAVFKKTRGNKKLPKELARKLPGY